jgi:uncharacterized protein YuzE
LFEIFGVPVIRGVRPRPEGWQSDASIRGYTLLRDDDGGAWRRWFAAAKLNGFSDARHRYFSDTLLIEFRKAPVAETRDLDEDTILDVDGQGNICSITVEHASQRVDAPDFSYEEVAA